jgi:membrane peptidoglycan carboxypeptidase
LKENPDVAEAVRKGQVENAQQHYSGFGYFEGRTGGTPAVSERWYLATYPDVATAVRQGKVTSATEHYNVVGGAEGRSPSADYVTAAEKWKRALNAN